jgi:hypothetical protein
LLPAGPWQALQVFSVYSLAPSAAIAGGCQRGQRQQSHRLFMVDSFLM